MLYLSGILGVKISLPSWYCHFDDDMYVNVGALVRTLARYSPDRDRLYIGRWSVNRNTTFDVRVFASYQLSALLHYNFNRCQKMS